MKKITLLQFRHDPKILKHEYECFRKKLNLQKNELVAVNAIDDNWQKADLLKSEGVILGGSGEYLISDGDIPDTVQRVGDFLNEAIEVDRPVLGICFGSQIMCKVLGGEIEKDEARQETGAFLIDNYDSSKKCPIFRDLPENFLAMLGHKDHLSKLPERAIGLGKSEKSPNQAFTLKGKRMYGILFHPELEAEDMIFRMRVYAEVYKVKEKELKERFEALQVDTSQATSTLNLFLERVIKNGECFE